ncbi:MAG: hypothetical protein HW421_3224 [Ignavibacteria bacterium]|nr:hypothetical protein [Ignavibacteria bacterium]
METTINAYLTFNGNCREAMTFYQECIGGELTFQTIAGSPIEAQFPVEMQNQILHTSIVKGKLMLMASDMMGPEGLNKGNNFTLCLNCNSEEEIHSCFDTLSRDGTVLNHIKEEFWGALFGQLIDKFGMGWMFIFEKKKME